MTIDMSQFYQVFFEESAEHLATMEGLLLELDIDNPDSEQLNAIFRAAHSIKGSAGTFGFTDLAETTHILENLLDRIRKQELGLRADMVDAFLESGDLLRDMLEAHQGRGQVDPQAVASICARLRNLSADESVPVGPPLHSAEEKGAAVVGLNVPVGKRAFDIQFVPTDVSAKGNGLANLLAELRSFGNLEILNQPASDMNSVGYWQLRLVTDAGQESFADQIDFIAENGAWRVVEETVADDVDGDFGFFDNSPGAPETDPEYGFFSPMGSSTDCASAVELPAPIDESYGFFAPLPQVDGSIPAVPAALGEDGDGYGFFTPLPPTVPAQHAAEEGDGFGFFEPLAPPSAPVEAIEPVTPARIISIPGAVEAKSAALPARATKSQQGTAAATESSIRVSVEKVDQLINLVGELVITQAMLLQTAAQIQEGAPERLINGLAQLERNTRDLQESVMSIRMMQISFVFSRFPRVVRDLSSKLGKQVELKTSGETTELDKGLIERIADPLTHLIRNSLDHGIELPETRIAAGKSPVGTITLKAYHQGGSIVIEVGDDGAGLPRNKILAKARERGLLVSDQMTDSEVFNLIFEAGFSTADQVTDVSGRGVGMDVVRRNIQSMGGRVEIESMLGVGTRMTVRLPLTLAILDGMSIAVGDQTYILPLSYVVESFQPKVGDIKTLSNQARVIQVRGEFLPVVVLHELFNIRAQSNDFSQGIMVVIDADGIHAALFVDALIGQHQVVIKSLEANYRRVPGISGATIMGDGHVALILDVSAIAGMAKTSLQKAG
ncbi:MAG: chemotaxis protein CheW [Gammaproteobacteria bacterium]|nr:chemotaxis protein CheW [Gammaproteobacteria bacterium]MBU1602823.1 chemotaxis protein CheW [Gammaproteobacteria bacterium]MBU2432495.1 chemotaxis protein CheW [Gammaproteobacteria bacterium]MBU2448962.1 chemotaxis protein CheW [Gammaproteobacteria bacterium]